MATAEPCPGAPTLLAFVEGRLDASAREGAEFHFDRCTTCLSAVAELGRFAVPPRTERQEEVDGLPRYELGPQIARGGMGRILRAWDRKLGRAVALKTVADDRSASLVQRLRREMALTARLQHPSIVPIYDAGRLESGEPYYAMRWIEGRTLRGVIDECRDTLCRLALLPVVLSLAEAIAYAHDENIVHRDIKPSNVIVGTFGETVVLDWGLAKDLRESTDHDLAGDTSQSEHSEAMTADGQVMGTPGYIAPEQARGEPVDERADVYAVGVILLELASGEIASDRDLAALYRAARDNVPPDLVTIVQRATHADKRERYANGSALVSDLRRYTQGRLVLAHAYTLPQRIRRFVGRHRLPIGLAAAFVASLMLGGSLAIARVVNERDAADEARQLAQQQRERAEERRDAAQKLVQFIVNDLNDSLGDIGRADLLAEVARSALEYFEGITVTNDEANATDLLQESITLHGLGGALIASSDIKGARRAFEGALARALTAQRSGAPDGVWWACSARERLGYITSIEGDEDGAKALLEQVVADANRALRAANMPSRWVELAGPALISLYMLEQGSNDARASERLAEAERLANTPVGDPDAWARSTADLKLAVLQFRARHTRDAGDWVGYRAVTSTLLDAARQAHASAPDDAGARGNYVAALMEDASACERQGEAEAAFTNLQVALELATVDAERDPSNTLARATLGTTLQFLANNARERDRLDEAAEYFARAETVAGEIRKLAPDHVDLLRTQAASAGKYHCLVQNERGAHDLALAACSRSLEALDHAYTIDPSHPARERDVLSVSTLAARAAVGAGKREESRAHAERATSLAQKIVDAGGNAGDRLALADALLARATLAHREGDRKVQRECTDRARSVLADLDPAPDPTKAASLRDELARLSPRTP